MKKFIFYTLFLLAAFNVSAQSFVVTSLSCESRKNPLGVGSLSPHLSWELQSNKQNVLQTAYRILVADDSLLLIKNTGNIWDSKKIISNSSVQVRYKGKQLQSAKKYYWKVMVWDNQNNVTGWSSMANWQMGLLKKEDWKNAEWIALEKINDTAIIAPHVHGNGKKSWGARKNILPVFRKDFIVNKKIKSATAFVCGLGHFDLFVNGKKIGDHFLDPGWTNYAKHAQYASFDITRALTEGNNVIGAMLGNGFYYIPGQRYRKMTGAYGSPKMIMRTMVEYTDGSRLDVVSDESWKTTASPILFSSIFGGEDYDASMEQAGWNSTGFNDQQWKKVIVTNGPAVLDGQMAEPIKIMQRFSPVAKTQLDRNTWVYDLGQNFSGIPFITVAGNKGDTVLITPAELINKDGAVNQKATGSPYYYTYILKGDGDEHWQPRFTYYGFRYLQVKTIAADSTTSGPFVKNIEGLHIRNSAANIGSFTCSNELFNKTNTLIDWAIKSNTMSVFTDCPHREKLGWLEQTHLMGASVQYNYNIAGMCRKVILDMMNAQYPDGMIPEIAPEFTKFTPPFDESPEWGSAAIILPWYNYQWYGDKRTLQEAYSMMKGYIGYLQSKTTNHILTQGLGDWFDIGPKKSGFAQMTKMGVTATATFYYDLSIMVKVARLLNKQSDVNYFERLAQEVKNAFNQNFFDYQKLRYDSASQTANAMALYMNLVEPQYRHAVTEALIKDIRSRNNALTAGDIGYRYVLKALEEAGRSDVIFDMNSRDDVPGYGFQLKHGATALTESWQAYESVSNNHFMLGHLMEWFYTGLAGIKQSKNSVAYKTIVIRPETAGDVTTVAASYHSPHGLIKIEWEKKEQTFMLKTEIPANATAIIYLPANKSSLIYKDGKQVNYDWENSRAVIKVGSGKYNFTVNQ